MPHSEITWGKRRKGLGTVKYDGESDYATFQILAQYINQKTGEPETKYALRVFIDGKLHHLSDWIYTTVSNVKLDAAKVNEGFAPTEAVAITPSNEWQAELTAGATF